MRIATWNVNGIRARAAQLCEWLERDRPDVVCLQELKAETTQIPEQCKLADYHAYWHGRKGYSGVSIHVRRDLCAADPPFSHPPFDVESRIVQVELGHLVIASVYVPNGGKDYPAKLEFVRRLIEWTRQVHAEGHELVLCGDMNIARTEMDVHPKERKPNAVGQLPEERALFETLLGEQFVDVGRLLDPHNPDVFTWWAPWRNLRARNIGWRLDYFIVSRSVAERATACIVQADVGTSDHAPVMLAFEGPAAS
jgi:exodeoxyribonuclease-3